MHKHVRNRLTRRLLSAGSLLPLALTLLGGGHAYGQGSAVSQDDWQYEVMPYLWATRMKGDVQAGPLPKTSVDMKFGDILENLDFGFMTAFEARKGRWGFILDGLYMKVSDSATASRPNISVGADVQVKQSMLAGAVAYRAIEGSVPVDVIGGLRYNKIDVEAKIDASLFGGLVGATVKRSGDKHWTDPYVGARVTLPINEKWKGIGYVDIGGAGSGSDFTWQGMAGLIYSYSPTTTLNFGYRYMKVDYDDGGFKYDMANDGLYLGLGLRF